MYVESDRVRTINFDDVIAVITAAALTRVALVFDTIIEFYGHTVKITKPKNAWKEVSSNCY